MVVGGARIPAFGALDAEHFKRSLSFSALKNLDGLTWCCGLHKFFIFIFIFWGDRPLCGACVRVRGTTNETRKRN